MSTERLMNNHDDPVGYGDDHLLINDDVAGNVIKDSSLPTEFWPRARWYTRRFVGNLYVRIFSVVLVVIDVTLFFVQLGENDWNLNKNTFNGKVYDGISTAIIMYFVVELCLRIFAKEPKHFFKSIWNIADFLIIVLCAIFEFALEVGRVLIVLRLFRLLIILRLLTEQRHLKSAARMKISQNKRRYQDDGFDLDLTYITDRVIAMSLPSMGRTALYRNPIEDVARFFKTKHPEHFIIFNTCIEKEYDVSYFDGRVVRFGIFDHNVPSIDAMLKFCEECHKFLRDDPENVIAVHCKGGKGRTGTMICAWLLYSGKFAKATDALDYFADRRTDLNVSQQFQGVQTPSQSRFVGYFERVVQDYNRQVPPPLPRKLRAIRVRSFQVSPENPTGARSLDIEIMDAKQNVLFSTLERDPSTPAFSNGTFKTEDGRTINTIDFDLHGLDVQGEVKVKFHAEGLPKNYDNCPFYFWFSTTFELQDSFFIPRELLDNPHKPKTWKFFDENFGVDVMFEDSVSDVTNQHQLFQTIDLSSEAQA